MDKELINKVYGTNTNLNKSLDDIWNSVKREEEKEKEARNVGQQQLTQPGLNLWDYLNS